uniref:SPK domain-containing protein n=1 Tax=Caenorhabditis japonica TaxID=281687 RepID=A0A8R1J0C5_CAEJA
MDDAEEYEDLDYKDPVPYTAEEDHLIWEKILKYTVDTKNVRFRAASRTDTPLFWRIFVKISGTTRSWQSLCRHFNYDMRAKIMDVDFPMAKKIELLHSLSIPLTQQMLDVVRPHTTHLSINAIGRILYASGPDFELGKKESCAPKTFVETTCKPAAGPLDPKSDPNAPNNVKYPYIGACRGKYRSRTIVTRVNSPKTVLSGGGENLLKHPENTDIEEKVLELIDGKAERTARTPRIRKIPKRYLDSTDPYFSSHASSLNSPMTEERKPESLLLEVLPKTEPVDSMHSFNETLNLPGPSNIDAEILQETKPLEKIVNEPESKKIRITSDEPGCSSSSIAPTFETLFEDMEQKIRNFTEKVKNESSLMTAGERLPFVARLEFLAKIFRQNVKEALVDKKLQCNQYRRGVFRK